MDLSLDSLVSNEMLIGDERDQDREVNVVTGQSKTLHRSDSACGKGAAMKVPGADAAQNDLAEKTK